MNGVKQFNWIGWLVLAALLCLWEYGARSSPKLQYYFPPVSQILYALGQLIISGRIAAHLLATISRFLEGYMLAALLAVSMGVFLGYFRFAYSLLETLIEFLRPMPSVAIVPVAVLALGIGDAMIVAVTIYASVWPMLVNTIDGVRRIEPILIDTARTFGLGRWAILWRVVLPGASPYIVTGLRISLSIALILVTTAEMIAGSRGLGFFILDQERSFNSRNMYAGIIVVAALGYALNRLFLALENKTLRWQRGMVAGGSV
ncbi:MAG: ABC transporter permease [Deltaproteobacteria bacterium]|nr:ABC transporter permease [Deltaproteobacteria bacterium]